MTDDSVPPGFVKPAPAGGHAMRLLLKPVAVFALSSILVGFVVLPAGSLSARQLKAKTLSLSNMPTGWSVDNSSSSSGGVSNLTGCFQKFQSSQASFSHHGKGVVSASVRYVQGGSLPALKESLASGKGYLAAYKRFVRLLGSCKAVSLNTDGVNITGDVGAMSFPKLGDATNAYAIKLSAKDFAVGIDVVIFRVGQIDGDLLYGDLGSVDPATVQTFVTEAVNTIKGLPATPPQSSI